MWAALAGFFSALPDIVAFIKKAAVWLTKISGGDIPGWLKQVSSVMSQWSDAKTEQERKDAAKAMADLIGKL